MFKVGLYWFNYIYWAALIPFYIILAPLCLVSSSLFDWAVSWVNEDQTITLIIILIGEWIISALLILQLMMNRTSRTIFFYEFVFFLCLGNFILIGITYSLLQRSNLLEQFSVKVCTSLLLTFVAEKAKMKLESSESCIICYEQLNQETLVLKCSHVFHENCLWNWMYQKQQCPLCRKKI